MLSCVSLGKAQTFFTTEDRVQLFFCINNMTLKYASNALSVHKNNGALVVLCELLIIL